jgi:hypothetical protein
MSAIIIKCSCGASTSYKGEKIGDIISGYGICIKCQSINNVETHQKITDEEWLDLDAESRSRIKRFLELLNESKLDKEIEKLKEETSMYRDLFNDDIDNAPFELIITKLVTHLFMNKDSISTGTQEAIKMAIGALQFLHSTRNNEGTD